MSLKLRRGTNAQRLATTPEVGELIYTTDTKQLYVGDGLTAGGSLVSYNGSIGGNMGSDLVLSSHNITGTGNIDITGTITSTGNIISRGNITAEGNVIMQGNIELGNGANDNVSIGGDITSNIIPNADIFFDLGTTTQRWNNLFANNIFADLEGNIRAYDSTVAFNAATGQFNGQLNGTVVNIGQTAVQGNVSGNVVGGLTGQVKASNGSVVVDNGTDGTDAVFTGTFNGTLNGTVTDGVLTTDSYADPSWITSLSADKIQGGQLYRARIFDSDFYGAVLAFDSSILVDSYNSVLRGTHIGDLQGTVNTGGLQVFGNTILGLATNDPIYITPQGTGKLEVSATIKAKKLELTNDPITGGLTALTQSNANKFITFSGAYDAATSSASNGYTMNFSRSRGTGTAPTSLLTGDEISTTVFTGLTGSNPATDFKAAAAIVVKTDGTVSTGVLPGAIEFSLADSAGTLTRRLTIQSSGVVRYDSPTLTAGDVDILAGVATYLKVNIGGTDYAIPAYALV